jgi:hypothetical protein
MNRPVSTWLLVVPACLAAGLAGCDDGKLSLAAPSAAMVRTPASLTASAVAPDQIDVTWQDNVPNESGFEVHRSTTGPAGTFTLLASTGAGVTSYSDAGLTPSTPYCYRVLAFKRADGKTSYSGFSNTACATTPIPPAPTAPSAVNAKPANSTTVGVRWSDNSTNEDGFRIQRSPDVGSTWTTVGTVGANVTSSLDGGLASEQPACYRVIAFNSGGDSPPSNADCTTPPAAPTGLTATGGGAVDLAWTENSLVEDGYAVQRAEAEGGPYSVVANLAANSSSYRDVGVSSNTTYWYRVRATKDGGFSDPSNVASAQSACVPTSAVDACGNGIDDDCDGLVDVFDPDCACAVQECYSEICPQGYVCGYDGCCVSHCFDGVQDGDEADVDCGGSCSSKCQAGQHCWGFWDCASGVCVNSVCQP